MEASSDPVCEHTCIIPSQPRSEAQDCKRGHHETAKLTVPRLHLKEKVYYKNEREDSQRYLGESKATTATSQGGREGRWTGHSQGYLRKPEKSGERRASEGGENQVVAGGGKEFGTA